MLNHKKKLSARSRSETGIKYEWYALQRWGAKYWDDFSRQKIVFPAIMSGGAFFALDLNGYMVPAPGNILTGRINLQKLLLFLTTVGYWALRRFYMGGGIEGELKVNRLELLPIPTWVEEVETLQDIYDRYCLTDDEIKFISSSVK